MFDHEQEEIEVLCYKQFEIRQIKHIDCNKLGGRQGGVVRRELIIDVARILQNSATPV